MRIKLILIIFFLYSGLYAKDSININSDFKYIELGKELEYLSTAKDELNITNFINNSIGKRSFIPNNGDMLLLNENEYEEDLWIRFKVKNTTSVIKELILHINNPLLDNIEYFEVKNNKIVHQNISGDNVPLQNRFIYFRNAVYPVTIDPNSTLEFYFKINLHGRKVHVPLELFSYNYFIEYISKKEVDLGFFYGILACLSVITLILFFLIKERVYFYLASYFFIQTFLQIAISGIAYTTIWPDFPFLANRSIPFLMSFSIFLALLFLVEFFKVNNIGKYTLYIIRVFQAVCIFLMIASFLNDEMYYICVWILYRILPIFYVGFFVLSSHIFVKKFLPARFFFFAFSLSLFSIFAIYYYALTKAHNNIFTNELVIFGEVMKSVLLIVALLDRLRIFKNEKEIAQAQVISQLEEMYSLKENLNKELSEKINQKTHELSLKQNEVKKALIMGEESERKRIAQELHDGLGSLLSTLRLNAESIFSKNKNYSENETQAYESIIKLIDIACEELRNISHNMMPVGIEEFGLIKQLVSIIRKINSTETIQFYLHTFNIDDRLDKDLELSIYRICLELINNIIKHSKAKIGIIQFTRTDSQLILIVEDDGIGFDINKKKEGIGLISIFSRVEAFNGKITIDSNKLGGTTTIIEIPLNHE